MGFLRELILAVAALLALATTSSADIFYTFSNSDPAAGRDLQVNLETGQSTTLPIYLAFTGPSAASLTSELGLRTIDVQLLRTTSPSSPVGIVSPYSDVAPLAPFDVPGGSIISYASSGDVDVFLDGQFDASSSGGVLGSLGPGGSIIIPLTNLTFTAGATGEITIFTARDFFEPSLPASDDTITFKSLLALDSAIVSADVTFAVHEPTIPEPIDSVTAISILLLFYLARTREFRMPRF
jgi:hypothetical protein